MAVLRIYLFGKMRVEYNQKPLIGFESRKVQELFCYLLLNRFKPQPREELASRFWTDYSTAQSKKYLRHTLWQLQTALDPQRTPLEEKMLSVEVDWIQLNPAGTYWLDVDVFEKAVRAAHKGMNAAMDLETAGHFKRAVSLYQGDLLEGWYQDWCIYERERLQNLFIFMLNRLAHHCALQKAYAETIRYSLKILELDRANERAHQMIMRQYSQLGDRTQALRQYERCVAALQEELDVAPSRATIRLYEQIRDDQVHEVSEGKSSGVTNPRNLDRMLDQLYQLNVMLADLQDRVSAEIQKIYQALDYWDRSA